MPLLAQSSSGTSEDIVELSPFEVSTEPQPAYKVQEMIGRVRQPTPIVDPRTGLALPGAPVTLVKHADAVAVQFVLSNNADKQEVRNQELYSSVTNIEAALQSLKGAKIEQREVRFTGGDRRLFSLSSGSSLSSFVSLLVLVDLPPETRVADRVKQVRDVLGATKLVGKTKYNDGSVGLYLRDPDQYRRDILEKIFADVSFLKKGFGDEFEILPSGLTNRVKMRVAGEADIELWIEYAFTFRSIRELEAARAKKS